jgi:uncharacterized protein (TIGR00255 family)
LLKSMTGYGSSERADGGRRIRVEVRSVNQRFLDVQVKAPRLLLPVEDRIRRLIESTLARGRVTVYVDWRDETGSESPRVSVAATSDLVRQLRALAERLSIPGEIDMDMISRFPQILEQQTDAPDADELWEKIEPVLSEALDGVIAAREAEGKEILDDLVKRLGAIEAAVNEAAEAAPKAVSAMKERLAERIRSLLNENAPVDEARLAQELAMAAERADYTEETVRLRSHIAQARQCLEEEGPVGKRLNFLVQEMHREANTAASKNGDAATVNVMVSLKEEIEKLREQVQNVE